MGMAKEVYSGLWAVTAVRVPKPYGAAVFCIFMPGPWMLWSVRDAGGYGPFSAHIGAGYAGSWIRVSGNTPFTRSGE